MSDLPAEIAITEVSVAEFDRLTKDNGEVFGYPAIYAEGRGFWPRAPRNCVIVERSPRQFFFSVVRGDERSID